MHPFHPKLGDNNICWLYFGLRRVTLLRVFDYTKLDGLPSRIWEAQPCGPQRIEHGMESGSLGFEGIWVPIDGRGFGSHWWEDIWVPLMGGDLGPIDGRIFGSHWWEDIWVPLMGGDLGPNNGKGFGSHWWEGIWVPIMGGVWVPVVGKHVLHHGAPLLFSFPGDKLWSC